MSFAIPSAFGWLALAVPVVLLYILKVRLRRVPVSTNMFWKQLYDEKPPRALWQQLRHWSSLLLQLLLLLLIVLALADPFLSSQTRNARRIVLVLDNSGSMNAVDVAPSRLAAAQAAAIEMIDGIGMLDEAAVIVASKKPSVICGMTGHLPTLKAAVESISPSDGSANVADSIAMARRLIGTASGASKQNDRVQKVDAAARGAIVVFTDGCVTEADAALLAQPTETTESTTSHPEIVPMLFGSTTASNVGITQLQSRRSMTDPASYRILVKVQNASDQPVRCRLELQLNNAMIDVFSLRLAANEVWSQAVDKISQNGGILKAELSRFEAGSTDATTEQSNVDVNTAATVQTPLQDGWSSDNVSYSVLPARPMQKVLLISEGNLFLQKVLEAMPLVELTLARQMPDSLPAEFLSQDSVIVIHGRVPDKLPPGNVFVIDPSNDCEFWKLQGTSDDPLITEQDQSSPLLAFVNFQNVSLPTARRIEFSGNVRSLVKTISGDVLYAELPRTSGRCLMLSMSLDESDLVFRTVFPIVVSNALNWFSGTSADLQPALTPDDISTIPVPSSAKANSEMFAEATLIGPAGHSRKVKIAGDIDSSDAASAAVSASASATVGPFPVAGLWTLKVPSDAESLEVPVAVNVADSRETDLRLHPSLTNQKEIANIQFSFSRPIWMILIVLACVLTSVEWLLYHRRVVE